MGTDIIIIGAGPVGLFTVFEAGLLKLKCHLIDALPQVGGQLTELYPKKPIFDIPGIPSILAGKLVDDLMEQCKQFQPTFSLGETAVELVKLEDLLDTTLDARAYYQEGYKFLIRTNTKEVYISKAVIIAGGLGTFLPRKPNIADLVNFEDRGVDYFIKDPEKYRGKKVVIAGGGDSALDWSIFLSEIADVTLVHRSNEFRGAIDSLEKVKHLKEQGKIKVITEAEVFSLAGQEHLKTVFIRQSCNNPLVLDTDYFIPLFGLVPKLGPIADWGFEIHKNAIEVETSTYTTSIPGVYAIGDVNTYENKLKLILCGFHEGTMAVQDIYKRLNPNKKFLLKYTTVSGVDGFDGTRKESEKLITKEL